MAWRGWRWRCGVRSGSLTTRAAEFGTIGKLSATIFTEGHGKTPLQYKWSPLTRLQDKAGQPKKAIVDAVAGRGEVRNRLYRFIRPRHGLPQAAAIIVA